MNILQLKPNFIFLIFFLLTFEVMAKITLKMEKWLKMGFFEGFMPP